LIWTLLGLGLAFLALVGVGGWLVVKMAFAYLDRQIEIASRLASIEERKVAIEESKVKGPAIPASMPPDLMRRVNAWQDIDARDQERKILLDLFAEYQDWDKVRAALPKAPTDEIPEHPELGLVA
jgi:hypothetical protein